MPSAGGFDILAAGFSDTVQTQIERNLLETLRSGLAFTPAGSVVTAAQRPGGNGDYRYTLWTDTDPDLSALDEITPPSPTFMAGDNIEFSGSLIGQYVPISWLASIQAGEDLVAEAVDKVSRMAAEAYDQVAKAAYEGATTDLFGGSGNVTTGDVAAGDILTPALLVEMITLLRERDVKPLANGRYALVGHPRAFAPLLEDFADGTVDAASFGVVGNLIDGAVGSYLGFDFVPTSRGIVAAGGGTGGIDVHKLAAIGSGSLAMSAVAGNFSAIVRASNDVADPLGQIKATVGYKAFVGAALVEVANRSDGAGIADAQVQRSLTVQVAGE